MNSFDLAFDLVVGLEGGHVDDPRDPGGETIYGITRRDHPDLWRTGPPTLEQAKERYRTHYWEVAKCDKMPWPISCIVFDAAVNQGPATALKLLQRCLRVVADGVFGRETAQALEHADLRELMARYQARRAIRYTGTRNFDIYGEGWLYRLFRLQREVS